MTLFRFFNTNPWFSACLKFGMCITHSFLSCKLTISSLFQIKTVNDCESYVAFHDIKTKLQENILHHYIYWNFCNFTKLILIWTHLKPPTGAMFHIYMNYLYPNGHDTRILLVIIIFHVFITSFWILMNNMR